MTRSSLSRVGPQQRGVVTVGAGQDPSQRDTVTLDHAGAFHALLASVHWGTPGDLATAGGLGDAPVDGDLVQDQPHDRTGLATGRRKRGSDPAGTPPAGSDVLGGENAAPPRRPAPPWRPTAIVKMPRGVTEEEAYRFLATGRLPARTGDDPA
jgi:hypothetical protein